MELINESNLENVCGGGKITKVVEGISMACIAVSLIGTFTLLSWDAGLMEELEKRKHPQITADHVVYVVKETHFC